MNKRKIFNDPVYGFVTIPYDIVFDIIAHPLFQRLRRIQQLGLSSLVYPGATHTRFHHSIGAMHLMYRSLEVLKSKGHPISDEEAEAATLAILMHDLGHGPFSHSLEESLLAGVHHETISLLLMKQLEKEFGTPISLAIEIFQDTYPKKFLHQLVSGQLDMDRMDYLNRDSFYTGVSEGVIGYDRIINMLEIHNDTLVVEEKGVYSVEKFLVARRLMYWQVYLHKTSLCGDLLLQKVILRAKHLWRQYQSASSGSEILDSFLQRDISLAVFEQEAWKDFIQLDDTDILQALKHWTKHPDKILSALASAIIDRKLFKIIFTNNDTIDSIYKALQKQLSEEEMLFWVIRGTASNNAYNPYKENILILMKDGSVKAVTDISEQWNIRSLSQPVEKQYICYPKFIQL